MTPAQQESLRVATAVRAVRTSMPYTVADLYKACDTILAGGRKPEALTTRVLVAETIGLQDGRSIMAPSMRVVIQASLDFRTYGQFRFGKAW